MEANTVGKEAAREYLDRPRRLQHGIENKKHKIVALRDLATRTTAAISDMPRSDSPNLQRMETMLCKAADLEREIVADQVAIDTAKEEIMAAVFDIEDYREQQVLYHRYVECQAWSAVAEACGCHIRTAHRFHDRGVEHMAEKLSHTGHPKNT